MVAPVLADGTVELPYPSGDAVLNLINQDGYSAEYLNVGSLVSHRFFVRHSVEAAKNGNPAMDRHNIDLLHRTFATASAPVTDVQAYMVIRTAKDGPVTQADEVARALAGMVTPTILGKILAWQST